VKVICSPAPKFEPVGGLVIELDLLSQPRAQPAREQVRLRLGAPHRDS